MSCGTDSRVGREGPRRVSKAQGLVRGAQALGDSPQAGRSGGRVGEGETLYKSLCNNNSRHVLSRGLPGTEIAVDHGCFERFVM